MPLAEKASVAAFMTSFTSADQVADLCGRNNIKGVRGQARCCVLTELLQIEFPGTKFSTHSKLLLARADGSIPVWCVALPDVMVQFVRYFDSGRYPELYAPPPPVEPYTFNSAALVERLR